MTNERSRLRLTVICEDRRQERFFRGLFEQLGFPRPYFLTAPAGEGAAENWVRLQYPREVRKHRGAQRYQNVGLCVVRDGDNVGVAARKRELDEELMQNDMDKRQGGEHISTPVPTWSIETWLLSILGRRGISESEPLKHEFGHSSEDERQVGRRAAEVWLRISPTEGELPSLRDARIELVRIAS